MRAPCLSTAQDDLDIDARRLVNDQLDPPCDVVDVRVARRFFEIRRTVDGPVQECGSRRVASRHLPLQHVRVGRRRRHTGRAQAIDAGGWARDNDALDVGGAQATRKGALQQRQRALVVEAGGKAFGADAAHRELGARPGESVVVSRRSGKSFEETQIAFEASMRCGGTGRAEPGGKDAVACREGRVQVGLHRAVEEALVETARKIRSNAEAGGELRAREPHQRPCCGGGPERTQHRHDAETAREQLRRGRRAESADHFVSRADRTHEVDAGRA